MVAYEDSVFAGETCYGTLFFPGGPALADESPRVCARRVFSSNFQHETPQHVEQCSLLLEGAAHSEFASPLTVVYGMSTSSAMIGPLLL